MVKLFMSLAADLFAFAVATAVMPDDDSLWVVHISSRLGVRGCNPVGQTLATVGLI